MKSKNIVAARVAVSALCGVISSIGAMPVNAQGVPEQTSASDQPVLESIVVTARRRNESLMETPVAITAISQQQIANNLATDFAKLAEVAPQTMIGRTSAGTGSVLTIRGISSGIGDPGLDQSVLVVADNVPVSRGRIIETAVFDMQQVDVLAGPQALFFGKNSPAGVISLRSADPTDHFEASVKALYEFEADERWVEAALSGPITDTLKARLALRGSWMEGWMDNVAGPVEDPTHPGVIAPGATNGDRNPDERNYAARLTLAWTPTDYFDANWKMLWNKQRQNTMDGTIEPYCVGDTTHPTMLGAPESAAADCKLNKRRAVSALPAEFADNFPYGNGGEPYFDSKVLFSALTANARFDDVVVTSTTGYYSQEWSGSHTYSTYGLVMAAQVEDYELFTQELRVSTEFSGPVNFMGGVFYDRNKRTNGNFPDLFHLGFNTPANNWTTWETIGEVKAESYSFFAQLRWDIVDALELSVGARYSHDKRDGKFENLSINPIAPALGINLYPVGEVVDAHFSDDNVSPEATLTWRVAPHQILYGAYKTGFKSGGISNGALLNANATPESLLFGSEETDGFEIGYKAELLGGRLRLDVAAYRFNYDGLQVVAWDAETISYRISNAAAARTEGVTTSFDWLATDKLSFNGNIAYNRARYREFTGAQCYAGQTEAQGCVGGIEQDLSGKGLDRAPDLTFSLGADYRMRLIPGWITDFSVSGSFTDRYQAATDYHPGGYQDSFWRLNAALHFMTENEALRLSLIGRNLTDSYYMVIAANKVGGNAGDMTGTMNRPREVAVQLAYRF